MAVEYDGRRPRLPVGVAKAIDGVRGQTPFNRWVVEALEQALGSEPRSVVAEPEPRPAPARASEPQKADLDDLAEKTGTKRASSLPAVSETWRR